MEETLANMPYGDYTILYGDFIKWRIPILYKGEKEPIMETVDMETYFKWFNSHPERGPIKSPISYNEVHPKKFPLDNDEFLFKPVNQIE